MIQQIDDLIVSIVISAYNEEKYLPDLIKDLKRQTYNKENIRESQVVPAQGVISSYVVHSTKVVG